jgi:uridine kinase
MINPNDVNDTDIFGRKTPIFEKILEEINSRKQKNKAFVVGITGIDCSGKTKFAESLEQFLIARNYGTQLISLDDFHNPRVYRYSGKDQIENYYNKSFDIDTIIKKLLIPFNQKDDFSTRLTVLDWKTDKYEIEKEFSFHQDTIVIFEGVFLFRKDLSPYIDYKIFIEIPFEESLRRAKTRDIKEVFEKYNEKYLPAQKRYLEEYPPSETADMIIGNSDWENPKIKTLR